MVYPNSSRTKRVRPNEESLGAESSPQIGFKKRPIGAKGFKEAALKKHKNESYDEDLDRDFVAQSKDRNRLIAEQNQIAIFANDLKDPLAKKFFDIKRKIEFAKLMKEAEEMGINLI